MQIYIKKNWKKVKTEYYLGVLAPEIMRLFGRREQKIAKDKNRDNIPNLEIVEVISVYFNLANNSYQGNSKL